MKRLAIILTGLCMIAFAHGQQDQDPAAKKILDRAAAKAKQYTSIQTDFVLTIENRRDGFSSGTEGSLKIKGDKYYMESSETKMFYDGKTLWTYMSDINEVTITEPDKDSDDFLENPLVIIDFYNRDFKYQYKGETGTDAGRAHEIDLFPRTLDQPYSRFKVLIKKDTDELYQVRAVGKDGIDYTATLKNTIYNAPLDDALFIFPKSKYKGVEVVDLRF